MITCNYLCQLLSLQKQLMGIIYPHRKKYKLSTCSHVNGYKATVKQAAFWVTSVFYCLASRSTVPPCFTIVWSLVYCELFPTPMPQSATVVGTIPFTFYTEGDGLPEVSWSYCSSNEGYWIAGKSSIKLGWLSPGLLWPTPATLDTGAIFGAIVGLPSAVTSVFWGARTLNMKCGPKLSYKVAGLIPWFRGGESILFWTH